MLSLPMRRGLAGMLMAALTSACSPSPAPEQDSPLSAYREQATEEQRAYFDDGEIGFSDYRRTVFATVACLEAGGYVAQAELAEDGFYQYAVRSTDGDESRLDASVDECRARWSEQVEAAFRSLQSPTSEDLPAVIATIDCLRDAGEPPIMGGTNVQHLRDVIRQLPEESAAKACAALLPEHP